MGSNRIIGRQSIRLCMCHYRDEEKQLQKVGSVVQGAVIVL